MDDKGDDLGTHGELTADSSLIGNTANSNSSGKDSSEQLAKRNEPTSTRLQYS